MNRSELILHVGLPKTGTSSIQRRFASDASGLGAIEGIYYPARGQYRGQPGHHNLVYELSGDERFDEQDGTWDEVFDEVAGKDRSLVSSEQFFNFFLNEPKRGVEWLRETGARYDLRIIAAVRSYPDYLESLYTQHLRALASDMPPGRFFSNQTKAVHRVGQTLMMFACEMGPERLTVLHFRRSRDAWLDFAAALGSGEAEAEVVDKPKRVNARMGLNHAVALHRLAQNAEVRALSWWERIALSQELTKMLPPGRLQYSLLKPAAARAVGREAGLAFRCVDAVLGTELEGVHAHDASDWADISDPELLTEDVVDAVAAVLRARERD